MKIVNAASDIEMSNTDSKFMVVGFPGSGKSKLACTLPGKTLAWIFDPSGKEAYRGMKHVDIAFYPLDIPDMTVYSLSKEANLQAGNVVKMGNKYIPAAKQIEPKAYAEFGKDWIEFINSKMYEKYDNVVMDSNTTLQLMIMDMVLHQNQRYGMAPQQDDYPSQMHALTKTYRTACGLPNRVMFIFHDVFKQDDVSKRMMYIPILTGLLKGVVPSFFGHLLRCDVHKAANKTQYRIQTTADNFCNMIRTSFEKIDRPYHDVTILDHEHPQDYGLGKLIKENSK